MKSNFIAFGKLLENRIASGGQDGKYPQLLFIYVMNMSLCKFLIILCIFRQYMSSHIDIYVSNIGVLLALLINWINKVYFLSIFYLLILIIMQDIMVIFQCQQNFKQYRLLYRFMYMQQEEQFWWCMQFICEFDINKLRCNFGKLFLVLIFSTINMHVHVCVYPAEIISQVFTEIGIVQTNQNVHQLNNRG
eukprot:TRINITY_DN23028_c1_g1_i1.p1 TRINITY_DN23028_c1_g1~~TRINITY_DN23028_c1_g1_i1.p1  ORF type:complete len:191 (-),score=-14.10 TRINITY_DN23028_c1_g1_i1:902-1474(-)